MNSFTRRLLFVGCCLVGSTASAADPLHTRIDQLIAAKWEGKPVSAIADDAEFLRRVYLDFAGTIPSVEQTRAFLADKSADKRAKLVDQLLNGPGYPRRMADQFHIMLMERLGDHADWSKYLLNSLEKNKPWNIMAREILRADSTDEANRGASFFLSKRLENYGQNPVDYPALTRDIGRLFLGKNLQCAQCHDHLFIDEYKQEYFQGLFAFVQNAYLVDAKTMHVAEKATTGKVAFMSVFKKKPKEIGPAIPGGKEFDVPVFKKGEEFSTPPNPKAKVPGVLKFSPLKLLSEQIPTAETPDFARNAVNRFWFMLMGRGLVHPLDMHHSDNPPSHPELLDLLAKEFIAHQYDIKWLLREMALSQTYQRSSVLPQGTAKVEPQRFRTGIEKRLGSEQLLAAILEATGEKDRAPLAQVQPKFLKAFANGAREPEEEFAPALKSALFILNDDLILGWLTPKPGNLMDRLSKITDNDKVADELYLSILTRLPSTDEREIVKTQLTKHSANRPAALGRLAWALLASTEFSVNH